MSVVRLCPACNDNAFLVSRLATQEGNGVESGGSHRDSSRRYLRAAPQRFGSLSSDSGSPPRCRSKSCSKKKSRKRTKRLLAETVS